MPQRTHIHQFEVNARTALARATQAAKRNPRDPSAQERLAQARREQQQATLERRITDLVAGAPPLTDDQRERLRALLGLPLAVRARASAAAEVAPAGVAAAEMGRAA